MDLNKITISIVSPRDGDIEHFNAKFFSSLTSHIGTQLHIHTFTTDDNDKGTSSVQNYFKNKYFIQLKEKI